MSIGLIIIEDFSHTVKEFFLFPLRYANNIERNIKITAVTARGRTQFAPTRSIAPPRQAEWQAGLMQKAGGMIPPAFS